MVKQVNLTDEELINTQESDVDRSIVAGILRLYREKGYAIKARTQWQAKDDTRPEAYRVFCHIGKSKESLILNTRSYDQSSLELQIKIRALSSLENLDLLSENIRHRIIHARPCRDCGCSQKAYVFSYEGQIYRKCHMLCDNFRFFHFSDEDAESVLSLVRNELALKRGG